MKTIFKQALVELNKQVTSSPQDLFEWRLANRRMFGWLQIMLSGSPRLLLLYLKYFHHDVENKPIFHGLFGNFGQYAKVDIDIDLKTNEVDEKGKIDESSEGVKTEGGVKETRENPIEEEGKVESNQNEILKKISNPKIRSVKFVQMKSNALNNLVDEVLHSLPEWQFWLQWLLIPQLPFYNAIKDVYWSESYLDEILKFTIIFRFIVNCIELYVLFITLNFKSFIIGNGLYEIGNFIAATFYYHVLWHVFPSHLHDVFFYFAILVLIPNFTFFSILNIISMINERNLKRNRLLVEEAVSAAHLHTD